MERIIILLLKNFRAKNVRIWTIIVFSVGVLNYILQQAAQNFIVSDDFLQIINYVSLAYITLSNPELQSDSDENIK